MKIRVFSGIRATGRMHIGNYFGAVKGMLELQAKPDYETIFMVVDVHSTTTPYSPDELIKNKREIIIDYLSAGIDPEKSILCQQSNVPEHAELSFYFSTVVNVKRMQHLPTFKDKIKQHPHNVTMALLNYPILMAADILIYKAKYVPVGIDQEPHLEVAREIARKMNLIYGMNFPEPIRYKTKGEYVPSLKGEGKMSKSVEGSYVTMIDTFEEIQKKIRSVTTAAVSGGEMSEGVRTLFTLLKILTPHEVKRFENEYKNGTLKFVDLKDFIAESLYLELKPFQEKRRELVKNTDRIDKIIREGAERARSIAQTTVNEVKEKMGLS